MARLREEKLNAALTLALCWLEKYEPPDSRAVSDEFVAMAAVQANLDDEKCMAIIDRAIEKAEANAQS